MECFVLDILRCGTFVHLVEGDLKRRRVVALEVDSVWTHPDPDPGPDPGPAAGQLVRCSQSRGWKLYTGVSKSDWMVDMVVLGVWVWWCWCLGFRFNPTWMGDLVVPATRVSKAGRGLLSGWVGAELSFKLGFKLFYA